MKYCEYCGAQIEDAAQSCPYCGAQVKGGQPQDNQQNINQQAQNIMNTSDYTPDMDAVDIRNNKVMAVLAYLGILVLIPILAARDSKFARFHANQGLVLLIVDLAAYVVRRIVLTLLGWVPLIGTILSICFWLVGVGILALIVIGIINAVQGQAKDLPIIGSIRILN